MSTLNILLGLLIGALASWVIAKYKYKSERGISPEELSVKYVLKDIYSKLEEDLKRLQNTTTEKEITIINLSKELSAKDQVANNLAEKLSEQKEELQSLQEKFKLEFENIANRMLEEKSEKFLQINKNNLDAILNPLKEKIEEFKQKVETTHNEEIKDKVSLKTEIKQLVELNKQVSEDATKLAKALMGDSKTQGDWGEIQLEMILERTGLEKNIHFKKQETFKDDNEQSKRPDYIVHLPENKNFVIDSKVSLSAYEKYFNSENENDKKSFLKEHLNSIRKHIEELSGKNYHNLYQINSPDYILMFMPIEPAFVIAIREDSSIFEKALEKNIVLVTASTLLATLRTVSYMWKQEKQKRNVLEIARQSGALYDKFDGFIRDLMQIGKQIDNAKSSYEEAMKKLTTSQKKGDTIIGRIENLKRLGAKTEKTLPKEILDAIEDDNIIEVSLSDENIQNQENNNHRQV